MSPVFHPSRAALLGGLAALVLAGAVASVQVRPSSGPPATGAAGARSAAAASAAGTSTGARSTTVPAPRTPSATSSAAARSTRTTTSHRAAAARDSAARTAARATIAGLIAKNPTGSISVAAQDLVTGARYTAGGRSGMWTASAYKLLVLETVLLQSQHSGWLSDGQLDQAAAMIENSDNVAGYNLFQQAGGNSGLQATLTRLGMTHTVPGASDPTFTRSGAADYLRALRVLVQPGPLTRASRALALRLLGGVEADQRWGVSAAADRGTAFVNKNGWLAVDNSNGAGETDDDRWIVTSAGIVTVGGHRTLIAVMTQHQDSFGSGVALVERLARATAAAL